jgi:DNA-binding SARP family transcriptional activator
LTVPLNGELRGPDSQAVVTQVAWPYEADGYVANTGDRLVAFTVQLKEPTSDVTAFTSTGPTLSLVVDGSPQSLDTGTISNGVGSASANVTTGTGTESYVASVPSATHDVELSMTDTGYTQSFSLWSLKRAPGAPAVLYDDPTSSSVTEQLGITKTVSIRDPTLGTTPADVFITSAQLSAFNPASTDATAPPGHAYLVLTMKANLTSAEWNSANYLINITPLPGSAVTFTSATGRKFVAASSNVTQPDQSTSDDGMLDATYAFLVPSNTRGGIVSIGPATTSGQTFDNYLHSGPFDTIEIGGPVRFSVGFPKPPAAAPQPKPPWFDQPLPSTGLPSKSSAASDGLPVIAAVVLLLLLAGAILFIRRRLSPMAAPQPVAPSSPAVPEHPPTGPARAPAEASNTESTLRVEFMGPIRITPVMQPLTEFGRAFLSYLAVHDDRPRTVDDAQTALWPTVGTEADITRKTFTNHVTAVRRAVGTRHLPDNVQRNGYRLEGATTDWHRFRALAAQVERAAGTQRDQLRTSALRLVRGVPFESELSRWFQWADSEGLRTAITKAVVTVAVEAHAERVQAGDLDGAEWALRQGLLANPFELTLWACLADVIQARDDRSEVERYWRDATAALDPGAVEMLRDRVHG